jgi:hypothetical protein
VLIPYLSHLTCPGYSQLHSPDAFPMEYPTDSVTGPVLTWQLRDNDLALARNRRTPVSTTYQLNRLVWHDVLPTQPTQKSQLILAQVHRLLCYWQQRLVATLRSIPTKTAHMEVTNSYVYVFGNQFHKHRVQISTPPHTVIARKLILRPFFTLLLSAPLNFPADWVFWAAPLNKTLIKLPNKKNST